MYKICTLLLILFLFACEKTKFANNNKTPKVLPAPTKSTINSPNETDAGGNNFIPTPTATVTALPTIAPEDAVDLELVIVHYAHEAWYKDCVSISLANYSVTTIKFCNKSIPTTPQKITIHKNQCNIIRLDVDVTKQSSNDSCHKLSNGEWMCNYKNTPDWTRKTYDSNDRKFFSIIDSTKVESILADNAFKYLVRPLSGSSKNSVLDAGWVKGVRVFFEDLNDTKLATYIGGGYATEADDNRTIDYDDLVFELRGNHKNFTFEGKNYYWSPNGDVPKQGINPPTCE